MLVEYPSAGMCSPSNDGREIVDLCLGGAIPSTSIRAAKLIDVSRLLNNELVNQGISLVHLTDGLFHPHL